jgi:uncharacterized protein (TIGR03000 family)
MYRKLLRTVGVTALAVAGLLLMARSAAAQQGWPLQPNYGAPSSGLSYNPGPVFPSPGPGYYNLPAEERATPPAEPESNPYLTSAAAEEEQAAHLDVRLPAGAEIWFNNTKMPQTGKLRHFTSPPLTPGDDYYYEVRVRWHEGNRTVTRTRNVAVHAGDWLSLAFGPTGNTGTRR